MVMRASVLSCFVRYAVRVSVVERPRKNLNYNNPILEYWLRAENLVIFIDRWQER